MSFDKDFWLEFLAEEDPILIELRRETYIKALMPRQLSGHYQGTLLSFISYMIKPKYILEIGTFTGYSTICLAKGLQPDGKIYTIEINDELSHISNKYFFSANLLQKIIQINGDAIKIIPTLDERFDLVFIDADKRQYPVYYDLVVDKLNENGFIVVDNVFWNNKIFEPLQKNDLYTKGVIDLLHKVEKDNRVERIILPIRDGLMILRKK